MCTNIKPQSYITSGTLVGNDRVHSAEDLLRIIVCLEIVLERSQLHVTEFDDFTRSYVCYNKRWGVLTNI